jgi:hypothetical protein
MFRQFALENFSDGLITAFPENRIKDGAASDVLAWECLEAEIKLSGGFQQVGVDSITGTVRNIFTADKPDGTKVVWKKVGAKLYTKDGSAAWAEVGTDLFLGAETDIPAFDLWESFNGSWVWMSSPKSALWKIPVANPTSAIKYTAAGYKGYLKIAKSRLWIWSWPTSGNSLDLTGLQGSFLPAADIADAKYTDVTGENIGTGTGAQTTFTDTLAAVTGTRDCFAVSATDGTETFADTGSGTLTGSAGGTGTINYATGAISVTFAVAPTNLQAITANYTWEDEASDGLADFSPLTAAAGDGKAVYLSQPSGGAMRQAYEFNGNLYCVHERAVWRVSFDEFGDPSSNLVFRAGSGTSAVLGAVPTSDGIYFIDDSDSSRPNIRVITLDLKNQAEVICPSVTDGKLDLSGWTLTAMGRHNDNILVAASDPDGLRRVLVLVRRLGSWTVMPYTATCFASYGETAIFGDSGSGLVFTLMDGTDADDFTPDNRWVSGASELGYGGLKRVRELWLAGYIDVAQSFTVEVSNDDGDFTTLGTVYGTGTYTVPASSGEIGTEEIGTVEIGSSEDGASKFRVALDYTPDRFATSMVRLTALGAGTLRITEVTHHAVQYHGRALPQRFRV